MLIILFLFVVSSAHQFCLGLANGGGEKSLDGADLTSAVSQLNNIVRRLEAVVGQQQGSIQSLETQVDGHNKRIQTQQQIIHSFKEQVTKQQVEIRKLKQGGSQLVSGSLNVDHQQGFTGRKHQATRSQGPPGSKQHDGVVAFSAYHNVPGWQTYSELDVIPFSGVEFRSDYYDPDASTFTCPFPGVYYFTINVHFFLTESPSSGGVGLVKGGQMIGEVYSWTSTSNYDMNQLSTAGVVTECEGGEQVYNHATDTSLIRGEETARRTTFTGFLLAPL